MWSKLFTLKRILDAEVTVEGILNTEASRLLLQIHLHTGFNTCKGMTNEVENMFILPRLLQQMF